MTLVTYDHASSMESAQAKPPSKLLISHCLIQDGLELVVQTLFVISGKYDRTLPCTYLTFCCFIVRTGRQISAENMAC